MKTRATGRIIRRARSGSLDGVPAGSAPDLAHDRDDRRRLPLGERPPENAQRSLRVLACIPEVSEAEICVGEGALDDAAPEARRIRVDGRPAGTAGRR